MVLVKDATIESVTGPSAAQKNHIIPSSKMKSATPKRLPPKIQWYVAIMYIRMYIIIHKSNVFTGAYNHYYHVKGI